MNARGQEKPSVTKTDALSAKATRLSQKRRFLKFMSKRGCKMDRRLHSLERQMKL